MTELTALDIGDPPHLWVDLGFSVDHGASWVSGVRHVLGAGSPGITRWSLDRANGFAELPTVEGAHDGESPITTHPNGVTALDHIVIATPHMARTVAAFETSGMPLRRTRAAGTPEHPMVQSFFKAGDIVIEVVGAPEGETSGPARFWGLTYTVTDLDATAALLGDRLRPIKDAVQQGRRIATLDRSVGSTVPMAFMSAPAR